MRALIAVAVSCVAGAMLSCSHPSTQAEVATKRVASPPTATEVFNLRSKCAELAQKILANNVVGSALTKDIVSHYDPQTNRCYAELDVNSADLRRFSEYYSRTVFDGQTGEILVSANNQNGHKTAYVKDGGLKTTDFDIAVLKIADLMADDRKQ
jgi:hypothetical protein